MPPCGASEWIEVRMMRCCFRDCARRANHFWERNPSVVSTVQGSVHVWWVKDLLGFCKQHERNNKVQGKLQAEYRKISKAEAEVHLTMTE
jgi:hypothetical protein